MRLLFLLFLLFIFNSDRALGQETWTLQRAVRHARDHNISIRQNELNQRVARLNLLQSRLSQIPSLNISNSYGRSYGRSVDPTTNQFAQGSYDFLSINGSADVLLFGWFQKRYQIGRNSLLLEASRADLDQLKDDVSLNVATGFLRVLLAREQIRVSEKQVLLSKAELDQTRKFVVAGRLPELNAAQLESQVASDSAGLINAIAGYNNSIIDMKALLNLEFTAPFEVQIPETGVANQVELTDLNPELIFGEAVRNFGAIKSSELKIRAAKKNVLAARGGLLPQLGLNAQMGTNYATTFSEITDVRFGDPERTFSYVPLGDSFLSVFQPTFIYSTRRIPFGTQLENNFRQTIALAMNVPLFNSWQAQNNLKQAKISLLSEELNQFGVRQKLKQDVYKAYNEALNAIQKYNAAERAALAAQRAFEFARKRNELGLTNTVEYLSIQNNQFVSESNLLSAKYDLIFKLKVIDYYLGKELKL